MIYIIMLLVTIPLAYVWQAHSEDEYCPREWYISKKVSFCITPYFWAALAFLPLYCVYAFQYSLHTDYDNYEKAFWQIKAGTGSIREIGIHYINKLVATLNLDFQFVYIIIYLIAFCILAKCLMNYSKDYAMSIILFVTLFFALGFLQIRQLVAVVISFYAYRFISTNKPGKYFFTIVVACLFHVSAIIMMPAYFILKYDFKCSYYLIVSSLFGVLTLVQTKVLSWIVQTFLPSYYGRHEMFRNLKLDRWNAIMLLLILFLCAIYYGRVRQQQEYNRIFINGLFIYAILFFLGRWIIEFNRFGYYFFFPVISLIPNMLDCEKNFSFKWLLKIGICTASLLFWIIRYSGGEMFHYISVFHR